MIPITEQKFRILSEEEMKIKVKSIQCGARGPHGATCTLEQGHSGSHWGSAFFSWGKLRRFL